MKKPVKIYTKEEFEEAKKDEYLNGYISSFVDLLCSTPLDDTDIPIFQNIIKIIYVVESWAKDRRGNVKSHATETRMLYEKRIKEFLDTMERRMNNENRTDK